MSGTALATVDATELSDLIAEMAISEQSDEEHRIEIDWELYASAFTD